MKNLESIAAKFAIEGNVASIKPLGQGFINNTYFITLEGESQPSYILQTKNHHVFPDVPAMMDNIDRVKEQTAEMVIKIEELNKAYARMVEALKVNSGIGSSER